MGAFNGHRHVHHQTCDGPNSLIGAEKKSKGKIWGEMRQPQIHTLLRMTCLLLLSPVILAVVEGASLSMEHSEGQLTPRFYEQLEHHHYRPQSHQQFNNEGGNHGNRNLMNLRDKFGGGGGGAAVGKEEEELFEQDSVGGRSRSHINDEGGDADDDNGNDEIINIAASEVVPRRLQAVELLMEKYKQMENVKEEVEEREKQEEMEEESATAKEPEAQFKSEHHFHQHQRQHHNHPPVVPTEGMENGMARMDGGRGRGQGRALWSEDFDKKALELCGTSASLQCGKRVQSLIEGQQMTELSVHMKCDLRDDFLKCIDTQKRECLSSTVLPQLPPKDVIKVEQSKLWKILWTAGGCVLAD